jgi:DNA-binding MarR family transcriptional regulator
MTEIRELISYRLHTVANLLSRGAELRYSRDFGVSLWEWRSIALLGAGTEPLSLNHLAHAAGIHKSQMSRVVSGLTRRKMVLRAANGREVALTLTKSGRRLYEGLIRAASERDETFNRCLSRNEKAIFDRCLAKLAGQARQLIQKEKGR